MVARSERRRSWVPYARTSEVDIKGTSLIESGGAILRGKDGKVVDSLKYIVIWKKSGKSWKMHRDIFNSNNG